MKKRRSKKTGRNSPCPCGSGKKYKRCHGGNTLPIEKNIAQDELKSKIEEMQAQQMLRERQQGLGRPIISTPFKGYRLVAVGEEVHWSTDWKTFHDFLLYYIRKIFGDDWRNAELKKTLKDRHPILQWHDFIHKYQREKFEKPGKVHTAPMTGAVAAYLGLAYNLYLLGHNIEIRSRLLDRLKNSDQFHGAYYETYVAAAFIKAGFELEFENEDDSTTTHCEFTATCTRTRNRYSVEAKARQPNKVSASIGNQLYKALRKKADHTRVIFIDVNVPDSADDLESVSWLTQALENLRNKESSMTISDMPASQAYVFVTNHPYNYNLDTSNFRRAVLAEGFKIPDFKMGAEYPSIRAALVAREKHANMYQLISSLRDHYEIPSTFDGELPEFAFGEEQIPRLKIGQRYLVPGPGGKEAVGKLTAAYVAGKEKLAYGAYYLESGRSIIATCPLSDGELKAYRRHPDTFFGVYRPVGKKTDDPLELYYFFYQSYSDTPREKLLDFMKDHQDYEELKEKSQKELAITYCERLVNSVINSN